MAISTTEKFLLNNKFGKLANQVQLGTLIQTAETGGLAAGAVTATELATDAVTTVKILDLNVTTGKLAANAVTTAKITDANVTLAKLAAGITPSHVPKFAGKFTTLGGNATEDQTLSGVVAGDVVIATLQDKGGTPRTLLTAKPGTDKITYVFSGDPSTDHTVSYVVYRAAA